MCITNVHWYRARSLAHVRERWDVSGVCAECEGEVKSGVCTHTKEREVGAGRKVVHAHKGERGGEGQEERRGMGGKRWVWKRGCKGGCGRWGAGVKEREGGGQAWKREGHISSHCNSSELVVFKSTLADRWIYLCYSRQQVCWLTF